MKCKEDKPRCCSEECLKFVIKNPKKFGKFKIVNGYCDKLSDGKCSIYKDRPQVCRDYFCPKCKYK